MMISVHIITAFALWLGAAVAAPNAFSTAGRLLQDNDFMQALPEKSMRCLSANKTEVSAEVCAQLSYVDRVHNLFKDLAVPKSPAGASDKVELDTSGYASQFEHRMVRNM